VQLAVTPGRPGFVASVDARALGILVVALGGGRRHADDEIDPAVGLTEVVGVGDEVGDDRPLAIVHARSETDAIAAESTLRAAMSIGDGPRAAAPSPVLRTFGALG
jgi:thymidine phosphorylase